MHSISEETLTLARRLDRQSAEAVLTEVYPAVWRMAHALAGRADVARKVVDNVFRTSLRVMPSWGRGLMAENWFFHHTLLNVRGAEANPPPLKDDLLVTGADDQPPQYLAFISALRKLTFQQREAFVLHHGEHFNERALGIAMDSSTTAAGQHLRAATDALSAVAGDELPALARKMAGAYAKLGPTEKRVVNYVRTQVSRAIWRKRIRRFVRRIFVLAILAAMVYFGWRFRDRFVQQYRDWQNQGTPATQPGK